MEDLIKGSMGDGSDFEQTMNKSSSTRNEANEVEEREIKVITFAKQSEQQMHPVKLSKANKKEIGIVKAVSFLSMED